MIVLKHLFQMKTSSKVKASLDVKRSLIYVLVWVVDDFVACSDLEQIKSLKENFKQNFKMEENGELRWFLGIKIEKKLGEIRNDQKEYTEDLLQYQGMSNCNPLKILVTVNENFVKANDNDEMADATSFWRFIGSLLFLAEQPRPDKLYGVNNLSLFMNKPTQKLRCKAKKVISS